MQNYALFPNQRNFEYNYWMTNQNNDIFDKRDPTSYQGSRVCSPVLII